LIEDQIENPISIKIINGEFNYGEKILVDLDDNKKLVFTKKD